MTLHNDTRLLFLYTRDVGYYTAQTFINGYSIEHGTFFILASKLFRCRECSSTTILAMVDDQHRKELKDDHRLVLVIQLAEKSHNVSAIYCVSFGKLLTRKKIALSQTNFFADAETFSWRFLFTCRSL